MWVTITSIQLKSWRNFFPFVRLTLPIPRQARNQKGFIAMKATGFGTRHFTLSAWESEESLALFARRGAHLVAVKKSAALAAEVATLTYQTDALPRWKEAKQRLRECGKILKYKKGD